MKLLSDILKVSVEHRVSREAVNKFVDIFTEASVDSKRLFEKFAHKKLDQEKSVSKEDIERLSELNALNVILMNGWLATWEKRNTLVQKNFKFSVQRKVLLGHDESGGARHLNYFDVTEQIQRFFSCPTVCKSFQTHKESVKTQPFEQGVYGDFFTSQLFQDILATLTPEEKVKCGGVPLCLGLYR